MNSQAKPSISRRTPARKRDRIRDYAKEHGLTYSAAEEKLLESGLTAERGLETVSPRVTALYFGITAVQNGNGELFADEYDLEAEWHRWRDRFQPPYSSWWAFWRCDKALSAKEADSRAEAARKARVTPQTGTSWVERERGSERTLVFLTFEDEK